MEQNAQVHTAVSGVKFAKEGPVTFDALSNPNLKTVWTGAAQTGDEFIQGTLRKSSSLSSEGLSINRPIGNRV